MNRIPATPAEQLQQLREAYDLLPYDLLAHYHTQPALLAARAALHGLNPPPPERSRILELGAATGGNLLALALELPGATCTGVELSPRQVALARQAATELRLDNIEFREGELEELAAGSEVYDYILCHGVWSWVPDPTRDALLQLCRARLAPDGVALVSYNTYPGWHEEEFARALLRFGANSTQPPAAQLAQGCRYLQELARIAPLDGAQGARLRSLAGRLTQASPNRLFHDFLEVCNQPIYFEDFVARAQEAGLTYVDELERDDGDLQLDGPTLARLNELCGGDPIRLEQSLDHLRNRTFRSTLLCRAEARPQFRPEPAALRTCHFLPLCNRLDRDPTLARQGCWEFEGINGVEFVTSDVVLATALQLLSIALPRPLAFPELWELVVDSLAHHGIPPTDPAQLTGPLLQCLQLELVEARQHPSRAATRLPVRPTASPLARWQAAQGQTRIITLLHRTIPLDPAELGLLRLLDGSRSVDELVATRPLRPDPRAPEAWLARTLERFLLHGLLEEER